MRAKYENFCIFAFSNMAAVAQLVRVPDCGSVGRRFESDPPPKSKEAATRNCRCFFVVEGCTTQSLFVFFKTKPLLQSLATVSFPFFDTVGSAGLVDLIGLVANPSMYEDICTCCFSLL